MSFESVNVMNKQDLGCNSSKTVEHGHDALDSRMSCSSDREEGEVEDGEIDDDEEGKVDNNDSASTIDKSPTKPKPHDEPNSEDDGRIHNSKRHKDRKRRHRKEKRHHHVSHKRHRGSSDDPDGPSRRDHSPSMKKSRRTEGERKRSWDFDRPSPSDEDSGVFGVTSRGTVGGMSSSHRSGSSRGLNNHSSNNSRYSHDYSDDGKRSRIRRHRTSSGQREENEKESLDSAPSDDRDSEEQERMQDLLSDGDDLDLDVAVHERDGAFQRPSHKDQSRQERLGPKAKKKKKPLKAKEYWHGRQRKEEFTRRRENERERKRCRFYMEGRCGKADHCPFSHDFNPPKKLELCKFYAISSCLKGEYCVYMHEDFPCKFYHTGPRVCKYENKCKFSHDQLTRDTKKVLERFIEERENNNADGNDENSKMFDPFIIEDEEPLEEPPIEVPDDRKNSLLGSPPLVGQDRGRGRGFGHESSPCDGIRGSSPSMQRNQGPTPPPFAGHHQTPQNVRPQSSQSPQSNVSSTGNINQHNRSYGMNSSPGEQIGGQINNPRPPHPHMSGPMSRRPIGANQGGHMAGPPGGPMMMQNRPQSFSNNARMGAMMGRPPANMVPPRNMMMSGNMTSHNFGMGMGGSSGRNQMGNDMGGYVDPQLDDLASMLVKSQNKNHEKQQGDGLRGQDDESTSMLKAAGADDSDLDEEGDTLDAMVHRMRKESEEQQRRQQQPMMQQQFPPPNQTPGPMQNRDAMQQRPPFQQYPSGMNPPAPQPQPLLSQQVPPLMPPQPQKLQSQGPMMMGRPEYGMGMGIRSGYNPQQMFNPPSSMQGSNQGMFLGNRPPVNSQSMGFSPTNHNNNDGGMENGAKELYLRIAKQTATGRQEQLAKETERQQKSPDVETPASPPPCDTEVNLGPREWNLIILDVPLKTPYPLMRLPHDLHYSRSDPRLTGQLRLVGNSSSTSAPTKPSTPTHSEPSADSQATSASNVPSVTSSSVTSPPSGSVEMGGRAYTPSMSNVNVGPATKDPRLGRQISSNSGTAPEIPAALLQKPMNDALTSFKLDIDVDPHPRPPPKMQLSERASSFQSPTEEIKLKINTTAGHAVPSLQSPQADNRSYLMDPRFRRRKASVPPGSTGSAPDSDTSVDGSLSTPEKTSLDSALKKDTTPVPSSGESSPLE